MVHIKDELDKTGHELIELRQAKIENTQTIQELKVSNPVPQPMFENTLSAYSDLGQIFSL